MGASEQPADLLLRAEIRSAKESLVSYARELTSSSVFVVTDWRPPLHTQVDLRMSFPSLVDPIDVTAHVSGHRGASGVGKPAGIKLTFSKKSDAARRAIDEVIERIARPPAGSSEARAYRVLLVEDNTFIRDMFAYGIQRFFAERRSAVEMDHALDVKSAWEKLADGYDLVIVDYYLPAEDGASLITRMRRDPRFHEAPVVAISVGGSDAREATISAGADIFLDKPIVLRDLFNTLKLLSQRGAHA
ncbi:MAG TPA: response regulator [Polyangiaceae bacterium]